MKVLSVFGTRPEAVKMAPVVKVLENSPAIDSIVCITAQHREMLDQVLTLFNITPDIDLDLMKKNQSLADLAARILQTLSPVIQSVQPDWILAQGDTTTVMTTTLLGYYHQVKVGHVEAGLRTHNNWEPFPEEINRRIAGVVADLHFAPTQHSKENLLREGIPSHHIKVTGNTVIDALNEISSREPDIVTKSLLSSLGIPSKKKLVLVTAHRRENIGEPMKRIFTSVRTLAEKYKNEVQFIYPVHLNPKVQEPAHQILGGIPNIQLIDPLSYLPLIHIMKNAALVLTDSGGIQEEATAMHIPTLVLRNVTERPEGVEAGVLKLVGDDPETIMSEFSNLIDNPSAYSTIAQKENPFGDGHASEKIVEHILNYECE
ncbi:MAG: UDP-N-acetylglucosamine 2-epimerase (non-hydrolyzing) [Anaerolineaceae bacterium]|nr:UDP-N-acetylglucosamine 2-epimerase (non-hydrolyzing) [Anaerolineaceae bacterium]